MALAWPTFCFPWASLTHCGFCLKGAADIRLPLALLSVPCPGGSVRGGRGEMGGNKGKQGERGRERKSGEEAGEREGVKA